MAVKHIRSVSEMKAEIIREINDVLVKSNHECLSVEDFDVLFDMSIDELYMTKDKVKEHCLEMSKISHN